MNLQKPQQKSLEQKISECRQVLIQNMEKSLQHKMIWVYFKDQKLEPQIKNFSLNSKDGLIKVEFHEAKAAKAFYEGKNFNHSILIRPFNIYYNLQLNDNEMKKYYIEGVTEDNQRKIFQAALKIGPLKLYTHYNIPSSNARKLKPKGIISFIRREQIDQASYHQLVEELKNLDVKITPYVADKGLKCSISVYNFFKGDTTEDDKIIANNAQTEIRNLIKNMIKDNVSNITISVKRRQDKDAPTQQKVSVTALLEFADNETTMDNFELLRKAFVNLEETKAVLFFHNHQNNSYFSIYTSNLEKKNPDQTDKQFEDLLLETYKKINPDVIQANIYPVKFNNTYVGRIYLKSEEAGKNFLVDYPQKRQELIKIYKDTNNILFNINVDSRTMKRIKMTERKAAEIARSIKNNEESLKKANKIKKAANQMPLGNMKGMPGMSYGVPSMGPIGGIPSNMGNQGGMGGLAMNNPPRMIQPIMGIHGIPPVMGGIAPPIHMHSGNPMAPPMGAVPQKVDQQKILEQVIRDKETFIKMQPNTSKRLITRSVKHAIEKAGLASNVAQIGILAEKVMTEDLNVIFRCLENEDELKKKVLSK